jgi:methyl-accepting chemotaxis protein
VNFSIRTVLLASFVGIGIFVSAQAGFGLHQLGTMLDAIDGIYDDQIPSVLAAQAMQSAFDTIRIGEASYVLSPGNDAGSAAKDAIGSASATWQKNYDIYKGMIEPAHVDEMHQADAIAAAYKEMQDDQAQLFALADAGKKDEAAALFTGAMAKLYRDNDERIATLVSSNNEELKGGRDAIGNTYSATFLLTLLVGGSILVLAVAAGVFAHIGIGAPIARLASAVRELAGGNVSTDIPSRNRKNEIGDMARAVVSFRESIIERAKLEKAAEEEVQIKDRRQREIDNVISAFQTDIVGVVKAVDDETKLMNDTAVSLKGVADTTKHEAENASSAAAEASAHIRTISSTTEQLGSSIGHIAEQAKRASDSVGAAAAVAQRADSQVGGLTDAASHIGAIVDLISSIARQTNLLALNATIEAARAGEAGRGFAVVAAEVKSLAGQTAKATDDITKQVGDIQAASNEAASSIRAIAATMAEVTELANSIASAVNEQDAAAREISENIARAADGSSLAAQGVGSVSGAVNETTRAALNVHDVSAKLAAVSEKLSQTVADFVHDIGSTEHSRAA